MLIRHTTALFGVIALASFSTACGDDDTTTGDTPAGDTPTATTTGTTPPGASTTAPAESFADLQIRYEHPEAGVSFEYGVVCGPDSSEVTGDSGQADVDASEACDLLDVPEATDRLLDGPDDQLCTEVYGGPDTAEISGTLFDQEVDTVVDRTNGCGIADWDELLDELLPPAIGVTPPTTTG